MVIDIDQLLACGATYKKYKAGETIFSEGSSSNFYHQLVTGSVKWSNVNDEGKEFIQSIMEPGDSFGELPLFDDLPYVADATAMVDSLVIRLHKPVFLTLLKESPELHFAISKLMVEKMRYETLLLKTISSHDPEKCISTLLDYMKTHHKHICLDCNQLKLTRQQIAGMTGLRVETVIRTMRHMHDMGALQITRGKVFC